MIEFIESQLRPPFETYGIFVDEQLVGSASMSRMPESPLDPDLQNWFGLSAVIVHPDFRGLGLGRALVCKCLDRAEQQGGKGMLLEVNVPNVAKALYDSLGFEAWNVYECSYQHNGVRVDTVSMRKWLRARA